MQPQGARKDPTLATILSLCFPGAGYLYVGLPQRFVMTLIAEGALFCLLGGGRYGFLLALGAHVFFSISAGGAARMWNERNALAAPPPPPVVSSAGRSRSLAESMPPPPPPPPRAGSAASASASSPAPAGPPLDADAFLGELREAWTAHRAGESSAAAFAERKRAAIERVHVADFDDAVALLESTSALVGAGVMTEAERGRLRLRVGRR